MSTRTFQFVIFLLLLWFLVPSSEVVYGKEDEKFYATIVEFDGEVFLQKPEEAIWLPVEKEIPIEEGDLIRTGATAYAEILLDDGSQVRIEENTEVTLKELYADTEKDIVVSTISLWFGRLFMNIKKFTHSESRFDVKTPTMVAGVRGTDFIVETTNSEQTDVGVFDGVVAVGGLDSEGKFIKESEILLTKGHQTKVMKHKRPATSIKLKPKMLAYEKRMKILKKKAPDRLRILKNIKENRLKAHKKVIKKWEKIKREKLIKLNKLKNKDSIEKFQKRKIEIERLRKRKNMRNL